MILSSGGPSSQSHCFSSSHIWMWELDYKESWGLENWCFWTVVLEKTLESPLDCKEIQPVHPKRNQSWIFIGRTDAEAETLILWPPDVKNWLIWKDPDAGKDWRRRRVNRGGDGWMASLTRWTWVWASSGRWWWIGKPGMLQSVGSQLVGHDWATELNWMWNLSCSMWDLIPWPGIEPVAPALQAACLGHWTTREVPRLFPRAWRASRKRRRCQ